MHSFSPHERISSTRTLDVKHHQIFSASCVEETKEGYFSVFEDLRDFYLRYTPDLTRLKKEIRQSQKSLSQNIKHADYLEQMLYRMTLSHYGDDDPILQYQADLSSTEKKIGDLKKDIFEKKQKLFILEKDYIEYKKCQTFFDESYAQKIKEWSATLWKNPKKWAQKKMDGALYLTMEWLPEKFYKTFDFISELLLTPQRFQGRIKKWLKPKFDRVCFFGDKLLVNPLKVYSQGKEWVQRKFPSLYHV